ncbi:MAG: sigma-70 family RNA polymerase sigma factor [Candidatus Omnitrophica bacterium]|nr:sigma-70 family RNA polymerase sigma factor [Candidatus Omnitrophota bacterium]
MNELELINRCLKKEKKAWDIFVQKYSRLIYWAIKKRLVASSFRFDQDDVNCIFQEVFLLILAEDNLQQLKDVKTVSGWLAAIASNKALDFMRHRIREDRRLVPDIPVLKDDKFKQELHRRDLRNLISTVINTLSPKEKIIISLNLIENRTHQEISEIVGISINTVSTTIARSKEKLKKELQRKGIKYL